MATPKQERAVQIFVENRGKSVSAAMRETGYSEATAKNPKNLTQNDAWQDLLNKALRDKKLLWVHKQILNAQKVEHMVFPLGMDEADIKKLLNSVGSKPKKISHGEQAIHVWYWAPDRKAPATAVDLAYKLKGRLKTKLEVDPDDAGLFNPSAELTIKVVDSRDRRTESRRPSGTRRTMRIACLRRGGAGCTGRRRCSGCDGRSRPLYLGAMPMSARAESKSSCWL
jgi:hypothetical protein